MRQISGILFAALFTYLVSLSAGVALLRLLRIRLFRGELLFLGFILGSACLSLTVFLLTACSLASMTAFLIAGAVVAACGAMNWRWAAASAKRPALPHGLAAGWWLLYGLFAVLYLSNALLPETGADALAYHVAFPARYLQTHGFSTITANLLAGMPQGVDMLFLFADAIGGHSAPGMVHLLYLLTIPFGILSYARRAGFPHAGAIGGLLFFLSPIAARTGTSAYVDVALAGVAFAIFYVLEIWREEPQTSLLVPLGMLAGFAFTIKYTAFLVFPYVLACVLWRLWRDRLPRVRPLAILTATALVFVLPCLIKNQAMLGNPVAPFANRLFPNRVVQPAFEEELAHRMSHLNSVRLSEVPLETTVRGVRLTGVLGPVFLLAPLALLALRWRAGRQLLLVAVVFGLPYFTNLGTRFLLPCLPFVALAMGLVLTRPLWLGCAVVLAHAVLCYPAVLSLYVDPGAWRLETIPWQAALRLAPEEAFLKESVPGYEMCLRINSTVPPAEKIFSLSGFPQLYSNPELIISGQSSQANSYRDILLTPILSELRPTLRHTVTFAPRGVDRLRVSAVVPQGEVPWSVTELRVSRDGKELPRESRWRLRASSNIWEAAWAFDSNPVSRWTAGEAGGTAQYLEVDFGGTVIADCIWLDGPVASSGLAVQVLSRSEDGSWHAMQQKLSEQRQDPPPRLRRAAIETLRNENLRWLLVNERDVGSQDFAEFGKKWGITLIDRKNRFSLYHLD